jgi:hypothetical protein
MLTLTEQFQAPDERAPQFLARRNERAQRTS